MKILSDTTHQNVSCDIFVVLNAKLNLSKKKWVGRDGELESAQGHPTFCRLPITLGQAIFEAQSKGNCSSLIIRKGLEV